MPTEFGITKYRGFPMSVGDVPDLIGLLRDTLEQVEQIEGLQPDDPSLLDFKRCLVLIISELKMLKNGRDFAA